MRRKVRKHASVDYAKRGQDRRKLSHYLKAGGFRKVGGTPIFGRSVFRRRVWLSVAATVVLCVGGYFMIF
ncbi:MAG: hypothetical protein A2X49_08650 [Lentisphaerae bacterium GWF2_52_8]|nr:MAG: hypothetical protein A2X49_08650 [Lentisphaerae bacterium GWF2_52_8]